MKDLDGMDVDILGLKKFNLVFSKKVVKDFGKGELFSYFKFVGGVIFIKKLFLFFSSFGY